MVSELSVTREHGHQAEIVDDDQRAQTATRVTMASRDHQRQVGCVDEGEAERNVKGGGKGKMGKKFSGGQSLSPCSQTRSLPVEIGLLFSTSMNLL